MNAKSKQSQSLKTTKPEAKKGEVTEAAPGQDHEAPKAKVAPDISEVLQQLEELKKENERLKNAALDNSINPDSYGRTLAPTAQDAKLYSVGVKGNPTVYVAASNSSDARDLYAKWFNILSTEHAVDITEVDADALPENANPIHVCEDGCVGALNRDGELVKAGG